jgi:cytidine diphosphoramidate kinase
VVIWITGLSGAGKTTLCSALHALLKARIPETVMLDGDVVRAAFGHNLGHREEDRIQQVQRVQGIARALSDQGLVVLVAILYNNPELLAWNRAHLPGYFEVFVDAPLALVRSRDAKGLYHGAARGRIPHVVGLDIPWHAPRRPDMVVDASREESPDAVAARIARAIPSLKRRLAPRRRRKQARRNPKGLR